VVRETRKEIAVNLRILGAREVRELLPMRECIEATRRAMTLTSSGRAEQPIRTKMDVPGRKGLLSMMPGAISDPERFGIKIVSVFPENFGTAFGSHQGLVVLFDPEHGSPLAVLDGREITAIRTGAASAVATDALARADVETLGIYGYGEQAHTHLSALPLVRPFKTVLLWGRDAARARAFAEKEGKRTGLTIEVVSKPEELAARCDVLCTTTSAPEPFFKGEWLRPGTHINVVGSSVPTTAEIDVEAVRRSKVFVDYRASALALAGDLKRAMAAGVIDESHILGEVGEVVTGAKAGRTSAADITMFKSLGMISEDLTSAHVILRNAEARNAGTVAAF
jgi:ornithine cyclodeaminase/alanine dehydrogenase-like protein (mu-crystallin family)